MSPLVPALFLCAASAAALLATAPVVHASPAVTPGTVVAFDGARCDGGAYQYWLNGTGMAGPRAALTQSGNPVVNTSLITPAVLAGASVFVTGRISSPLAQSERDALEAWVLAGGGLLYIGDNDNSAAVNAQMAELVAGASYGGHIASPGIALSIAAPLHPLVRGPGGTVTTINNLNYVGRWVAPTSASTVVATNPDGSGALLAVAHGAGRAVLANDANYFCYPPAYTASHAALWVNVIAWLGHEEPFVPFCAGDGSATACPCANVGASAHGCPSSIAPGGASLIASGAPRVSQDSLVLSATGMPNGPALYIQGTTRVNLGQGAVFGDGLRCVGGTIVRLGTRMNALGASSHPDLGDVAISVRGAVPAAGGTRTYQVWYRAAAAFCSPATFNLSNGIEVSWLP